MKFPISTAAAALMLAAPAVQAQTAAPAAQELKGPAAGATVYGPGDVEAGTIESVNGNVVVLSTGTNKLSIPLDRFGKSAKGPTIALTREQLDALATQASAQAATQLKAKLVPGAEVRGSAGAVLATVKAATDSTVTLTTTAGKDINVPVAAVGVNDQGLTIAMTAAQFNAAVNAAAPTQ
jgi:hypothetical protein